MPTDSMNDQSVQAAIRRLNVRAWGISLGLVLGLGLLGATLFLVAKGGQNVGVHLNLLGNYLPGYRVSVAGALIGFVYAFVLGYGLGRVVGTVYNRLVR
ncbi:MAG: hypothetical protein ACC682_05665 [Gemmatimonadota bacterium]